MGVRGHGFCDVGTVCYLCKVYLIYRLPRPWSWAQVRSRSHYQVLVEMEDKPEIIKLMINKQCGDLDYGAVMSNHNDVLI